MTQVGLNFGDKQFFNYKNFYVTEILDINKRIVNVKISKD